MIKKQMSENGLKSEMLNPLFVISLLVLIVNDWVLKGFPGVSHLSGKLSDFAGPVVFLYFAMYTLRVIAGRTPLYSRLSFLLIAMTYSIAFVLINTSLPANRAYAAVFGKKVMDVFDCFGLIVIPITYKVWAACVFEKY